jgi:DNA-binding HxlR family transcriptional regulator
MEAMDNEMGPFCPKYHRAVELIGRRWTGAILRALLSGVSRFSAICETVPGLSDRMLAERLKELEAEGIVTRTVVPETPVRVEYALTAKGRDLDSVIGAVSGWAERWEAAEAASKL